MITLQQAAFDPGGELTRFAAGHRDMGACVSFTGLVRADDHLIAMQIEHYPAMTQRAITQIADQARARWDLGGVRVIHRYGRLHPGEVIMMVATLAPHRRDAFEAADFLMDYLKSRAPFWKQEITPQGARWVDAKPQDEEALARW